MERDPSRLYSIITSNKLFEYSKLSQFADDTTLLWSGLQLSIDLSLNCNQMPSNEIRAGLSIPEAPGKLSIGGPSQLKLKKVITTSNS